MAGRSLFGASCRIIASIYDPRAPEKPSNGLAGDRPGEKIYIKVKLIHFQSAADIC